jgi:hypothetical protein
MGNTNCLSHDKGTGPIRIQGSVAFGPIHGARPPFRRLTSPGVAVMPRQPALKLKFSQESQKRVVMGEGGVVDNGVPLTVNGS